MSRGDRLFRIAAAGVLLLLAAVVLVLAIVALIRPAVLEGLHAVSHPAALHPRLFGTILAVSALALAWQTRRTTRRGTVYCGRTTRASRSEDPALYRLWLTVHVLLTATLAAVSAVLFRL